MSYSTTHNDSSAHEKTQSGVNTEGRSINAKIAAVADTLSEVVMNGSPILNLEDFVILSDAINRHLGDDEKSAILSESAFRYSLGNFLLIRERQLRFAPTNEYTLGFRDYLSNRSNINVSATFLLDFIVRL